MKKKEQQLAQSIDTDPPPYSSSSSSRKPGDKEDLFGGMRQRFSFLYNMVVPDQILGVPVDEIRKDLSESTSQISSL